MVRNPNPDYITHPIWYFWEEFQIIEPTAKLSGIYANKPGYHNTRKANAQTNYSVREAPDKLGPDDKAAAIDITFPDAQRGDYKTIAKYCKRLMASSLDKNDPRLDGLREWYGQADSDIEVEGWDCRHLRLITSDPSHLWHLHISFSRGNVNNWDVMEAVLSVLRGETVEQWRNRNNPQSEETMTQAQFARLEQLLIALNDMAPVKPYNDRNALAETVRTIRDAVTNASGVRVEMTSEQFNQFLGLQREHNERMEIKLSKIIRALGSADEPDPV